MKSQLPGNNLLSYSDERKVQARKDRYGVNSGTQEFDAIVHEQKIKDGMKPGPPPGGIEVENDGSPSKASDKSVGSVDLKPVKEQKRAIINQQVETSNIIINGNAPIPGVLHTQEEIKRQREAEQKRKEMAVRVIQKWGRGMLGRSRASKVRFRMQKEIESDFNEFAYKYKVNDKFNLNRFLKMKRKVRFQNIGGQSMEEESISEQIGAESMSFTDI